MLSRYYDSSSPSTTLKAGDPLDDATLIGPLHTPGGVKLYEDALIGITGRGGEILTKRSGRMDVSFGDGEGKGGNFVWPTVVRPVKNDPCWTTE